MLKKINKDSKGFTLIEIVIVMAIGALIILVVIQAIGAARRSQRDNARKSQAGQISAAMEEYAANNNGDYPSSPATDLAPYTEVAEDYSFASTCGTVGPGDYVMEYSAGTRTYDLFVCLEAGVDNNNYGTGADRTGS